MNNHWFFVGTTVMSGLLLASGCSLINAPSDVIPSENTGGSGGGASSSSSSSSSSGMGGAGGNMMACQPGSQIPCYDGTAGTADIGVCRTGAMTCLGDGSGYGACEGQVTDALMDNCATPLFDENCDGVENEGCPGERLALIAAVPPGYADDVRNNLMGTGSFEAIDVYDASLVTPAAADLQMYQSVLILSDKLFVNPVALGDALADYFDAGGRVVLALYSTVGAGTRIQGKFGDPAMGYMITNPGGGLSSAMDDTLGQIVEPQSPLLRGVSTFTYVSSSKSTGAVINGGTVVAEWMSGVPLIIRGTVLGRSRVDVNFYPPQVQMGLTMWMGDGAAILRNAVLF